jgi:hypothetical protein
MREINFDSRLKKLIKNRTCFDRVESLIHEIHERIACIEMIDTMRKIKRSSIVESLKNNGENRYE